ncbi:IS21 family transposase [Enterococcus sp. ZJ1622]|uniref:IS21 family transposase n=1 Tax=Enterococcus sp. ZJ1622 TaxID=2709401 RepID=UPI0013EC7892|nr:IS21 family transposase [Enterococcus sp. ZJ1622]
MRKDIYEGVLPFIMTHTKPNYAALAKQYNCDYRTVKRYYEAGISNKLPLLAQKNKKTLVSDFEDIIADKLALGCSSSAIYHFISKRGYRGSARTLRRYCRNTKADKIQKATIRVETTPGLSAQVDWKENLKLVNKFGEVVPCNIFLYVLGYSRIKYLELTFDRSQTTLFRCLTHAFQYTGGVPTEIWFDNMKTVVDRSRSQFSKVVFNERFRQYAKEAGFIPIACRAFRPQTKGKVEALARTIERIRVFNYEFESIHECPSDRWSYEKEQLSSFDANQLKIYSSVEKQIKRKVSNEAMVQWNQNKYSVPVNYIGKILTLRVKEDKLYIYDDSTLIRTHTITHQLLNYHRNDYIEILRSDVFKHLEDEELERFVDENLQAYDEL